MTPNTVSFDMKGLEKLRLLHGSNSYVDIGIVEPAYYDIDEEDSGSGAEAKSVAEVASIHELGLGTLPERSWLLMPIEEAKKDILEQMLPKLKNLHKGLSGKAFMKGIGLICLAKIDEAFDSDGFGKWPDISEFTKLKKGHDAVLVDTEMLRDSTNIKVGGSK